MYRADRTFSNRRKCHSRYNTPHNAASPSPYIYPCENDNHKPVSGLVTTVTMDPSLCVILHRVVCVVATKTKLTWVNKTTRWQHTLGHNRGWFVHDMRLISWFLWLPCFSAVTHKYYGEPLICWAWSIVINDHKNCCINYWYDVPSVAALYQGQIAVRTTHSAVSFTCTHSS
jgi:hypothetical protein